MQFTCWREPLPKVQPHFSRKVRAVKVHVSHKEESKNNLVYHRPISILVLLFKGIWKKSSQSELVFEQTQRPYRHWTCISPKAVGEIALVKITNTIIEDFEPDLHSKGIFINYSELLGHMNQHFLISQLKNYRFRGSSTFLLPFCLRRRKQCVSDKTFV